jgi:predicted ABC-type ATPase
LTTPVLHLLAGPNGAGKSTFVARILQPVTHLPFVNADEIAAERWPGEELAHAYQASRAAAEQRRRMLARGESFITETVFSHHSKVALVTQAVSLGYLGNLHVILVPADLAVERVAERVRRGGHEVPEGKIRERYARLLKLVVEARALADRSTFYDNSTAKHPFRIIATFERGRPVGEPEWPAWTPTVLTRR